MKILFGRLTVCLILLQPSPSPPIPTWTGPGILEVRFEAGDVLWLQHEGGVAVFVPCESSCLLSRGGDALYAPSGELWTQDANGGTSARVLIPPDPFRYYVVLPIMATPYAAPQAGIAAPSHSAPEALPAD